MLEFRMITRTNSNSIACIYILTIVYLQGHQRSATTCMCKTAFENDQPCQVMSLFS